MSLPAIAISGCGMIGQSRVKAVRLAIQGTPDVQATAEKVAANHFPQVKVTGPSGGAILVLGNLDEGRQAWYSSERSIVFLRDGVVVATHGGSPELRQMAIIGANPFHDLRQLKSGTQVERHHDVMPVTATACTSPEHCSYKVVSWCRFWDARANCCMCAKG